MNTEHEVTHNSDKKRFEVSMDGHLAELTYMPRGEVIIFTHTGVPAAIGSRGVGSKLVQTGLDYARENGLKVRSTCWFVSKYIRQHPEYQDLLT